LIFLLTDDEEPRLLGGPFTLEIESALISAKESRINCSYFLFVDLPLELPGDED